MHARRKSGEFEEDKHPRDDHGRWTSGAGSSSSASSKPSKPSTDKPAADKPKAPKREARIPEIPDAVVSNCDLPSAIPIEKDENGNYKNWYMIRQRDFRQMCADKRKMTLDEYDAECQVQLDGLLNSAVVWTRCRTQAFDDIINGGHFKTQFETNTSGGAFNPDRRRDFERYYFGIPASAPPEDRPIYGYLCDPNDDKGAGDMNDCVSHYGPIAVKFKPDVAKRSTFTFGDSLDANVRSVTYLARGVRPLALADEHGKVPDVKDAIVYDMAPSPVTKPSIHSFDFRDNFGPYDLLEVHALADFRQYVETQTYGGLSADDIEKVVFYTEQDAQKYRQRLTELKIPWALVK